jgi:hypothetical protein
MLKRRLSGQKHIPFWEEIDGLCVKVGQLLINRKSEIQNPGRVE